MLPHSLPGRGQRKESRDGRHDDRDHPDHALPSCERKKF